jgi:magnesium-protoporphyrin IX monomethyl ester (oxidative) cyclase
MRAQPHLLRGYNTLWIRFFVLAVFATMYVRDHARPALHSALGLDPTTYDYEVFKITTACSTQVFPITLDLDNPVFRRGLETLTEISIATSAARARGGVVGLVQRAALAVRATAIFARLYFLKPRAHALPEAVRMAPAW